MMIAVNNSQLILISDHISESIVNKISTLLLLNMESKYDAEYYS